MNGRIFILIAVTGLFVHVWNANDPAKQRNVAGEGYSVPSDSLLVPVSESPEQGAIEQWSGFATDPALPAPRRQRQISESKTVTSPTAVPVWVEPRMMPEALPVDITCGLYQVVDNFGHMSLAQISPERLVQSGMNSDALPRDMYVHQEGNQRWYFIRQGEINVSLPRPAAANPAASLVNQPTQRTPVVPEVVSTPATEASESSLPRALKPTNLVRRQEQATLALQAQAAGWTGRPVTSRIWETALQRYERTGLQLQALAVQAFSRWPTAAQWILEQSLPADVHVLPQVSLPEIEVELPSIPLFRTAQPERRLPM